MKRSQDQWCGCRVPTVMLRHEKCRPHHYHLWGWAALLSLAIAAVVGGCRDEKIQSAFVQTPPVIDGVLGDWEHMPVTLIEDRKISIGAGNDLRYLYLAGRLADPGMIRSIERGGFTLWIDPRGRKSKDFEVRYPLARFSLTDLGKGGFWDAMTDGERDRASTRLSGMRNGVLVIDRSQAESIVFSPDSTGGFRVAYVDTNGILSFEARIPLDVERYFPGEASFKGAQSIQVGLGTPVSIQAGGLPFSGRGGGRMDQGEEYGRGRRGMMPGRRSQSSDTDLWVDVVLAGAP